MLRSPLLRLANIMFLLSSLLRLTVTRQACNCTANRAPDSVRHAVGEIVDLALRFLAFTGGVLLLAFLLE
jgi:hypothetical protein